MEIKRVGSQPSGKGPSEYFTGTVRVDPLFNAPIRHVLLVLDAKLKNFKLIPFAAMKFLIRICAAAECRPSAARSCGTAKSKIRALGHDPGRIYGAMALVIMSLGVNEIDGLANSRRLKEIARISP
jgi:hypothetical protein